MDCFSERQLDEQLLIIVSDYDFVEAGAEHPAAQNPKMWHDIREFLIHAAQRRLGEQSGRPLGKLHAGKERAGHKRSADRLRDAGRFLCNAVYYWLLARELAAAFVHVPPLEPGEPADGVFEAVEACARVAASCLTRRRPRSG